MTHDKFIRRVQESANLTLREGVEAATAATLGTLAEHMVGGEPQDLASQLPEEFASFFGTGG